MNGKTRLLAESSMLSALSVAILYLSGTLPTMKLALAAAAGLLPAAAVIRFGTGSGFLTYVVTGVLSLLLLPDKSGAVFYVLFFGHYPMVKSYIERIGRLLPEWTLKLAAFNACFTALLFLFSGVFFAALPGAYIPVAFLGGNAAFVLYDIGFTRLVSAYGKYLKKRE